MNRYTFLLAFNGGFYIRQINAMNLEGAINGWLKLLRSEDVPENGNKLADKFYEKYCFESESKDKPVPIDGMKSVWFLDVLDKNELIVLHVVGC